MKIFVIGDAILDRYVYGSVNRPSPEDASVSVLDLEREEYCLGGCLNVAANIVSVGKPLIKGLEVHLASVFSKYTGDILQGKGILSDDACILKESQNGILQPSTRELVKTRFIDVGSQKQLLRVDNRLKYLESDINLYKDCFGTVKEFDAIVISDYCKGLVDEWVLDKVKNFSGPIFIDTKKKDLSFWSCLKKPIVKINEEEFLNCTNKKVGYGVIVTMGPAGASYYHGKSLLELGIGEHYATKKIENPDVIGAGDSFLAGLVVKYMESGSISEAIRFANRVAAASVSQSGTVQVVL